MKTKEQILESDKLWDVDLIDADNFTAFMKLPDCGTCSVFCSYGAWEHVSVGPVKKFDKLGRDNLPTWTDMCVVKDMFWDDEEEVYQIHPKKSEYVNLHSNCLHLWKPAGGELKDLAKVRVMEEINDVNEDLLRDMLKRAGLMY